MKIDCIANYYVYGILGNGTFKCREDTTGGGGSSLYANYSNYSNVSYFWDDLNSIGDVYLNQLRDVDYFGNLTGDILVYNGTQFRNVSVPTGLATYALQATGVTNVVKWQITSAPPTPTLAQVLAQGDETSGNNITITSGDYILLNGIRGYMTVNYTSCDYNNCSITALQGDILRLTARASMNNTAGASQFTNLSANNKQIDLLAHRTGAASQVFSSSLFGHFVVTTTGTQYVNLTKSATATMHNPRIMIEVLR
jgi:hypothetical protein